MSQADFSWSTCLSRASRCSRDGNVEVAEKSSPSPKQPLSRPCGSGEAISVIVEPAVAVAPHLSLQKQS